VPSQVDKLVAMANDRACPQAAMAVMTNPNVLRRAL
jgi:hypothetical protein